MNLDRPEFSEIWVYLSGNPLFALILTLLAYQIGLSIHLFFGRSPLANPVVLAVIIVASTIGLIDMPYASYFEGAQFVHFLLGTATVSLAIPIYRGFAELKTRGVQLLITLCVGGLTSIVSAVGLGMLFKIDPLIAGGFYAKSVSTPIAMGVAQQIGASPTLTAVYVVSTGMLGAMFATLLLNTLGIRAWWIRGFSAGVAAHGLGVSRAFAVSAEAGAYASLGMGMHAILGAVFIPFLYRWAAGWL